MKGAALRSHGTALLQRNKTELILLLQSRRSFCGLICSDSLRSEAISVTRRLRFVGLISNTFLQMHRYTPAMLDIFEFRAAPTARSLLELVDILRRMNRDKSRSVPQTPSSTGLSRLA